MSAQLESVNGKYKSAFSDLQLTDFCVAMVKEYPALGYKHSKDKLNKFSKVSLIIRVNLGSAAQH